MTEIIPGLQGDIPSDLPKGIPYVAGRYAIGRIYDDFEFNYECQVFWCYDLFQFIFSPLWTCQNPKFCFRHYLRIFNTLKYDVIQRTGIRLLLVQNTMLGMEVQREASMRTIRWLIGMDWWAFTCQLTTTQSSKACPQSWYLTLAGMAWRCTPIAILLPIFSRAPSSSGY